MIYTVTLNPAIDYIMQVEDLELGKIHRSMRQTVQFGGKGINVSLILAELGMPSTALGFTAGFTGEALEKGIASELVKPDFVKLQNGLTRINVKLRHEKETDINADGPEISDGDLRKLYSKLDKLTEQDVLIVAGSIPKILPADIYEKIIARVAGTGVKIVVDAVKDVLLNTLKYRPFLIKPNNDELGEIFGVEINTPELCFQYAEKLQQIGARNVLVSMGCQGSVLLTETKQRLYKKAHAGKVLNTVGAGDSMVAGFVAGYLQKGDYEYALKLGTAAGSATAFSDGLADGRLINCLLCDGECK